MSTESTRIQLAPVTQPLAPASTKDTTICAESDACRQITQQLRRYVEGGIPGCSFLVAGHRGSGKTTAVHKAIEDVQREFDAKSGTYYARPLLVPLHVPDVLAGFSSPHEQPSTASVVKPALAEILRSLHRAIADELADHFSTKAYKVGCAETAAYLRHELDGWPELAVLREAWDGIDSLDKGVLGKCDRKIACLGSTGFDELLLIDTIVECCRHLGGQLEQRHERKYKESRGSGFALSYSSASINGLLASGGVISSLLLAGLSQSAVSAAIGLGAALLLGGFGFMAWRKSNQEASDVRLSSFLPDPGLAAASRILPLIKTRMFHVGLAPVFVFDEFDKLVDVEAAITTLFRWIKPFVSAENFFCFLVDREYSDAVNDRLRSQPYPPEHTYFTHRVSVCHSPEQLHSYLDKLGPSDAANLPWKLLRHVLIYRSKLHAGDLRRCLAAENVSDGYLSLPSLNEMKVDKANLVRVWLQLAAETFLEDADIRGLLKYQPELLLVIHDAAYFLGRQWESGEEYASLDADQVKRYLLDRSKGIRLVRPEATLIQTVIQKQATWLQSVDELIKACAGSPDSPRYPILNVLKENLSPPLALAEGRLRWRYTESGSDVFQEAALQTARAHREAFDAANWLLDLNLAVRIVSDDQLSLADIEFLFAAPPPPAWPEVRGAINLIRQSTRINVPALDADALEKARKRCVDYRSRLLGQSEIICRLLYHAARQGPPVRDAFNQLAAEMKSIPDENRLERLRQLPTLTEPDAASLFSPDPQGNWLLAVQRVLLREMVRRGQTPPQSPQNPAA